MRFTLIIPLAPERDAPILEAIKKLDYDKSKFHVVVVKGKNPSTNRNKGVEKSKGEYVIFLDDDAFIEENYLKKVDEFLNKNKEIDVIGGPQLTPKDDGFFGRVSGYALGSKFGAWKLTNRYTSNKENLNADETSLTSANLICRKEVFEKVKFDESLFPGEDPKFILDVKKQNFKVAYSPSFVLYHKRRPTMNSLAKQIFNYGKARPKKETFKETLKAPFFFIPSLFVFYLFFLLLIILINPSIVGNAINVFTLNNSNEINNSIILNENVTYEIGNSSIKFNWFSIIFLPLVAYIILVLLFTLFDSIKNKDAKAIFILPLIYPTIHVSYGAGMIYGYIRKMVWIN